MHYSLAIHGGAGTILKSHMTAEIEAIFHTGLAHALEAGETVLRAGGTAIDAVDASVCALEDNPVFNAGCGAVFNSAGAQEMDAAVMDGRNRNAGAVAGIFGPRNPVKVARAVMEHTNHVFLIGPNALEIARQHSVPFEDAAYFFTQSRWDALQETLRLCASGEESDDPARRHGTVGAVARDVDGNLAAATSTGGMTAKAPGRVGDTAVIGSGTFADNSTCAISCTGYGEIFIRWNAASEVAARMRHLGESLEVACNNVVMEILAPNDGSGGLIAVDHDGTIAMPYNSSGMYRAAVKAGSDPVTAIY